MSDIMRQILLDLNKWTIGLQQIMQFFDPFSQNLAFSQIRSTTGNDLSKSSVGSGNYHSLPHITQPILAKYRIPRPANELIIEQSSSFWCKLFSLAPTSGVSLCKCERTEEGHCEMVIKWINDYYDWKNDPKFIKAYQNYTRRNIEIFLTDKQLSNRLEKKMEILGVRLGQKYRVTLQRVCKNYLKHTIYYGKSQMLTRQNDLWMWFLIGIFYHIGSTISDNRENSNCEEQILFWSVDIIMNHFGNLTRAVFHQHIRKILDLIREYFPNWHKKLVMHYAIDLEPIVYEWINQLMMGYMGIQSIGFFVDCLLKAGWTYVYKVVLSFFEKRMEKMENDEIFTSINDREVITKKLINCDEEWPLIFCNANSFCFDKPQQNKPQ